MTELQTNIWRRWRWCSHIYCKHTGTHIWPERWNRQHKHLVWGHPPPVESHTTWHKPGQDPQIRLPWLYCRSSRQELCSPACLFWDELKLPPQSSLFLLALLFLQCFSYSSFSHTLLNTITHTFPAFILLICYVLHNVKSYFCLWNCRFLLCYIITWAQFQFSLLSSSSLCLFVCVDWIPVNTQTENTGTSRGGSFCLSGNSGKGHLRGCHAIVPWLLCLLMPHQILSRLEAAGILSVTLHISQLTHRSDTTTCCLIWQFTVSFTRRRNV